MFTIAVIHTSSVFWIGSLAVCLRGRQRERKKKNMREKGNRKIKNNFLIFWAPWLKEYMETQVEKNGC